MCYSVHGAVWRVRPGDFVSALDPDFDRWNPNPAGRMRVSQPSRRSSAPRTGFLSRTPRCREYCSRSNGYRPGVSKQGYQVGKQQSPLTRGRTSCCADPGPEVTMRLMRPICGCIPRATMGRIAARALRRVRDTRLTRASFGSTSHRLLKDQSDLRAADAVHRPLTPTKV